MKTNPPFRMVEGGGRIHRSRAAASALLPRAGIRGGNPKGARSGFNLVEALVATMILSGAVLTLSAISTNALSGTRLHRHYEMAAALVDKQLNLIDYMGIDAFLEAGQTEGIVDDMEPVFQWSVATEYQGVDDLYLVALTVTWVEGNRPYNVTVQTMLNGANSTAATGTTTETGGQVTP